MSQQVVGTVRLKSSVCLLRRPGYINIKADAVPGTCCAATDYVYLFKKKVGDVFNPAADAAVPGFSNVINLDYSAQCVADDIFYVCEKAGVLITNSIKATLTTQPIGTSCLTGTQLSCRT